jgi:dolichol kinase
MTENFSIKNEISRKAFHLLILIIPIFYYFFGKSKSLAIFGFIAFVVILTDFLRHKNDKIKFYFEKFFNKILRNHELEKGKFCGASWMFFSAIPIIAICKPLTVITSLGILAICDAMASIIGKSFSSSQRFFEKSLVGSCAFYISGLFVLFFCGGVFNASIMFYVFGFTSLFFATIIEARPSLFALDDNFTVPTTFASMITMFDLMWHFV